MGFARKLRVTSAIAAILPALAVASCTYAPIAGEMPAALATYDDLIQDIDRNAPLQEALRKNVARVSKPGDTVTDWNRAGLDLDATLEAAPGGSAANVWMAMSDGRTMFSSPNPFSRFFTNGFTTYLSSGPADLFSGSAKDVEYTLVEISDDVWLETAERITKIENASCTSNGSDAARIHARRSFSSLGGLQQRYLASLLAASRYDNPTICYLGEATGANAWRIRHFQPDGKRLPVFDREGVKNLTIVPITEAERIIAGST